MDQHTVRAYDKELEGLGQRIAEMGGIAEKMVFDAVDALASDDSPLTNRWWRPIRASILQREIEEQGC